MNIKYLALAVICIFIVFLFLYIFLPDNSWKYPVKYYHAKRTIEKIEKYLLINNKIPQNLTEINIPEKTQEKIFYMPLGDDFIVWFGMSLGESLIYESKTKEWYSSP